MTINIKQLIIKQQPLFSFAIIILALFLGGCNDPFMDQKEVSSEELVLIKMTLDAPLAPTINTRSASTAQEEVIDFDKLWVLIFEETSSGEEVFRKQLQPEKEGKMQISFEVDKSSHGEKYRFVILANVEEVSDFEEGDLKEEVLKQFTFSCSGKWDLSKLFPMWGESSEALEIQREKYINVFLHRALARVDVGLRFKEQTQETQTNEVLGLDNFKLKEVLVYRTKNKAFAATSEEKVNAEEVIMPNIPTDAKYNLSNGASSDDVKEADDAPLVYKLVDASNSFVHEIYIPESIVMPDNPTMDEVPCLVVGGYFGEKNTESITYYRVDFASYDKGVLIKDSYKEILRNHRYVVDIQSVHSAGFKEPDQALNSISTNMILDVAVWDEKGLDYYIHGDYFFQLDSRKVVLEASDKSKIKPDEGESYVLYDVPFTTNLDLKCEETPVKYKWGSFGVDAEYQEVEITLTDDHRYVGVCLNEEIFGSNSGAHIDCTSGIIRFKAVYNVGKAGASAVEREDILYLQIDNFKFSILVTQKAINLDYNLLCETTEVHGKYREGDPLNYTHFITLDIKANQTIPAGEEIEVRSHVRKGIFFEYKEKTERDILADEVITIKLVGKGVPTRDPNDGNLSDPENPKEGVMLPIENLLISSNSINDSSCENARIFFGYQTKRILALGANASYEYGYQLEPNTGSRAFVDGSFNFGVDPNSSVTMEQFPSNYPEGDYDEIPLVTPGGISLDVGSAVNNAFHIEYMSRDNDRMSGTTLKADILEDLLENFKPHIILTGQAIEFKERDRKLIADFVNKGGVFLMFNEYYPSEKSINAMVGDIVGIANLEGDNYSLSKSEFLFKLPEGEEYKQDPILNGPFGDLRGKSWGADGYFMHGFKNLPNSSIKVYNVRPNNNNPCFFHFYGNRTDGSNKPKAFIFIGDGGFISNSKRFIGPDYKGMYDYCPFAINSFYQPIPRENFLRNSSGELGFVYNSQLFGNILAWAVDWAESENGIKYK